MNLILSQLKLHRRNLDGEDDAQELKPHLDLGQVIEVGRRFTAFAISSETKKRKIEPKCFILKHGGLDSLKLESRPRGEQDETVNILKVLRLTLYVNRR